MRTVERTTVDGEITADCVVCVQPMTLHPCAASLTGEQACGVDWETEDTGVTTRPTSASPDQPSPPPADPPAELQLPPGDTA